MKNRNSSQISIEENILFFIFSRKKMKHWLNLISFLLYILITIRLDHLSFSRLNHLDWLFISWIFSLSFFFDLFESENELNQFFFFLTLNCWEIKYLNFFFCFFSSSNQSNYVFVLSLSDEIHDHWTIRKRRLVNHNQISKREKEE